MKKYNLIAIAKAWLDSILLTKATYPRKEKEVDVKNVYVVCLFYRLQFLHYFCSFVKFCKRLYA